MERAVRDLVDWALEDETATSLGLITLKPLRCALEAALRPDDDAAQRAWAELEQPTETLDVVRERVLPHLARWRGELLFGHYGAVRGLNHMADVAALVTLADPWPNLGHVAREVRHLEVASGVSLDPDGRAEALCRAELEQAHGRIRAIHRTRPGRALHVGSVMPGGLGWDRSEVEVRSVPVGRPAKASVMDLDELNAIVDALGGVSTTARTLGCDPSYVRQLRSGKRAISTDLAERLRSASQPTDSRPSESTRRDHCRTHP